MASAAESPETRLAEVADGVHAYLQPDRWGMSNAGLVSGDGASLLVDTLFDLPLTRRMLDTMAPITAGAPIRSLVNTHANGDHCYGNELVNGAEIVASEASAEEMDEVPAALLAALLDADFAEPLAGYLQRCFGDFDFAGVTGADPTRTFTRRLDLEVAGRSAQVLEVGPAHTRGDVLVHLPDAAVAFTGDILFIDATPIIWAGPISNWLAACDQLLAWDLAVIVPGHGPLTDDRGVTEVADYLRWIQDEATARHAAGESAESATFDIELNGYAGWRSPERLAINVEAVYRELDPSHESPDVVGLFERMARLEQHLR
jgi:glyoxylase-like metal-dependent hydrolase (beta-lactamase superfamily II)